MPRPRLTRLMRPHHWLGWLAACLTLVWIGQAMRYPPAAEAMAVVDDGYVTSAGYAAVSDGPIARQAPYPARGFSAIRRASAASNRSASRSVNPWRVLDSHQEHAAEVFYVSFAGPRPWCRRLSCANQGLERFHVWDVAFNIFRKGDFGCTRASTNSPPFTPFASFESTNCVGRLRSAFAKTSSLNTQSFNQA